MVKSHTFTVYFPSYISPISIFCFIFLSVDENVTKIQSCEHSARMEAFLHLIISS
jgi:hypothetical protein